MHNDIYEDIILKNKEPDSYTFFEICIDADACNEYG